VSNLNISFVYVYVEDTKSLELRKRFKKTICRVLPLCREFFWSYRKRSLFCVSSLPRVFGWLSSKPSNLTGLVGPLHVRGKY
jgi:hypothetical protein